MKFESSAIGFSTTWIEGYYVFKNGNHVIVNDSGEHVVTEVRPFANVCDKKGNKLYFGDTVTNEAGSDLIVVWWKEYHEVALLDSLGDYYNFYEEYYERVS